MGELSSLGFMFSIFEFYLCFLMYNVFIPNNSLNKKSIIAFSIGIASCAYLSNYSIGQSPYSTFIGIMGMVFICFYLSTGEWLKKVTITTSIVTSVIFVNLFIFLLLTIYQNNVSTSEVFSKNIYTYTLLLSSPFLWMEYMILQGLVKHERHIQYFVWKWILLISVFSSISIWVVLEEVLVGQLNVYLAYFIMISFIVVNCIVHYLCSRISKVTYENIEQKVNLEKLSYEEEISQMIDVKADELRKIKHDFTGHILAIQAMINENDTAAANAYLDEISIDTGPALYVTKNRVLNSQLARFNAKAKFYDIDVHSMIVGSYFDYIKDIDMVVIVFNLLDNAIEAARACEKKSIRIDFNFSNENMAKLIVRNTSNPVKIDHNGKIKTTKQDKNNHGFGISNIKHSVNKYDGVLRSRYSDGEFGQLCLLYRPEKDTIDTSNE